MTEQLRDGATLFADERRRQIEREGYTPEHDAHHAGCEMVVAAMSYANGALIGPGVEHTFPPEEWPWQLQDWNPTADPVPNLVKAGALLAAEVDRIQGTSPPPPHVTTVEQETELLAILRVIAPEDRSEGWHLGLEDGCDRRGEQEWRDDEAHEKAYEELSAEAPAWPKGMGPATAEWDAWSSDRKAFDERLAARAAEIAPTLTFPDDDLCDSGCPYPRARALLRAIEAG
jgi:hypothetical protein